MNAYKYFHKDVVRTPAKLCPVSLAMTRSSCVLETSLWKTGRKAENHIRINDNEAVSQQEGGHEGWKKKQKNKHHDNQGSGKVTSSVRGRV